MTVEYVDEILPFRVAWHEHAGSPVFASGAEGPAEVAMTDAEPRQIMNATQMGKAITAMAKQIHEAVGADHELIFMGIRTRGVPLAEWLAREYEKISDDKVHIGRLDINLYRDDLSEVDHQPVVKATELPVPIQGRGIILVDDVLFTGRTVRAALDALVDYGRPRFVQLAVLIERSFRELPIQAEYVGKQVKTSRDEIVKVLLKDIDGSNEVFVTTQR